MTSPFWNGKRVLITGGTAGLGQALARVATSNGAHVAVLARQPQDGVIQGDVANKQDTYRIAAEAMSQLGGLDILIHNASSLGPTPLRLLADTDCEDLELALATNVIGPHRLTKALLPALIFGKESRGGPALVLGISSDAAASAYPTWGAYGASKAAFDQLLRVQDEELRAQGVRSLAIDPGDMRTAMHFAAVPGADPAALQDPTDVAAGLISFLPLAIEGDQVRWSASQWRAALSKGSVS